MVAWQTSIYRAEADAIDCHNKVGADVVLMCCAAWRLTEPVNYAGAKGCVLARFVRQQTSKPPLDLS